MIIVRNRPKLHRSDIRSSSPWCVYKSSCKKFKSKSFRYFQLALHKTVLTSAVSCVNNLVLQRIMNNTNDAHMLPPTGVGVQFFFTKCTKNRFLMSLSIKTKKY